MSALAVFERLQHNVKLASTEEFAALTHAMAAFDFARAVELCEQLQNGG